MHDARDAEDTTLLEANEHARLLATYYPVIVERCRLRFSDPDAYEVAHRIVERLLVELAKGRAYSVPFRVVVHNVTNWKLKEFFTRAEAVVDADDRDAEGPDPFEEFEQGYDLALMFAGLPDRVREVMRLRYIEGLEIDQIAERLGIERNAVDQALHRGHTKLRETALA